MVLIRNFLWIRKWEWMRKYHPNFLIFSLAFTIPDSVFGTAMVLGALIAMAWNRWDSKSWYSLAMLLLLVGLLEKC